MPISKTLPPGKDTCQFRPQMDQRLDEFFAVARQGNSDCNGYF